MLRLRCLQASQAATTVQFEYSSGVSPPNLASSNLAAAATLHMHAFASCVGAIARSAPDALRNEDALVRVVVMPLLEATAADAALVASRANTAVLEICTCSGPSHHLCCVYTAHFSH
jgi:hydroxymethylglutaryl-CoA reductase